MVQNALIKFLSFSGKENHSKIIAASFTIAVTLSLFCIGINIIIAPFLGRLWNAPNIVQLFYISNIQFLLSASLTQFQSIEQANLKFKGLFITSFIRQSSLFTYLLACFFFNYKVELIHMVYIQTLGILISNIISYFSVKKYLLFSFDSHFK